MHFLSNALAQLHKGSAETVAAAVRTIFTQLDADHVRELVEVIATMLGRQFAKVETMLREAAEDVIAFAHFPVQHWKKIWLTNPLERVNKEIKCRTDVVGVFPTPKPCSASSSISASAAPSWPVISATCLPGRSSTPRWAGTGLTPRRARHGRC